MTDVNYQLLFSCLNLTALVFWVFLIVFPNWVVTRKLVRTGFASLIFGLIYITGISVAVMTTESGGFGSLAEVMELFTVETWVLVGWTHYLAFDLFVGIWVLQDAQKIGLAHFHTIPALVLTFILGPIGLVTYTIIKSLKLKRLSLVGQE